MIIVLIEKLDIKSIRVGSLDNLKYRPKIKEREIFDTRDILADSKL